MDLSPLKNVTTASLTSVLLKMGLRNVWLRGPMPLRRGQDRIVGPAFTLHFLPGREDLTASPPGAPEITTRTAIEAMPEGCIAISDCAGVHDAGVVGDILCNRMAQRKVNGFITDGAIRDAGGVLGTNLPVWTAGIAAPAPIGALCFSGWNVPIGCGGVTIFPGDILVADDDGVVVIPQSIIADVLREAPEQERLEGWTMQEVDRGAPLPGLYPMNANTRSRYES